MDELAFTTTIRKIVDDCIPDESMLFAVAGSAHTHRTLSGEPAPKLAKKLGSRGSEEFEFLSEANAIVEFVGVIKATYELWKWFKQLFGDDASAQEASPTLVQRWTQELKGAGLSDEMAQLIALKCSADVLELFLSLK